MMTHASVVILGLLLSVASIEGSGMENKAKLSVTVCDESGNKLPFRAYLKNAKGEAFYPSGAIKYVRYNEQFGVDERHFVANGTFSCELDPGPYMLRVEKGLEWVPNEEKIELAAGGHAKLMMVLHRWTNMNALAWFSGDTHIHRPTNEVELSLLAEDLNFGANITYWNLTDLYKNEGRERPTTSMKVIDAQHAYCRAAQEIERLGGGWGAVLFMGEFKPVKAEGTEFYPLTATFCEQARRAGAYADWEKPVWRDVPICAALGLVDSIGIVHNHFNRSRFLPMTGIQKAIVPPQKIDMTPRECALYTLDLYYHLLNCGMRLGASGGSANGVMPSPIGYERTYVRLDGPYSWDAWLTGLKVGRSFATNGPILDLTVADHAVGDSIKLTERRKALDAVCSARSQGPLETVEIIHNGKVIATETSESGAGELVCRRKLDLSRGWVAARCFERGKDVLVYAATSPVYLEYGDEKFSLPESGAYYRDFVQMLIDQSERENRFPDPAQHEDAMRILNRAHEFYDRIATR